MQVNTGFYDGVHFHRVIKDFMLQFGCPYAKDAKNPRSGTGKRSARGRWEDPSPHWCESTVHGGRVRHWESAFLQTAGCGQPAVKP
jgi:hypothetical protein